MGSVQTNTYKSSRFTGVLIIASSGADVPGSSFWFVTKSKTQGFS
jgi:hypothetical protein